ncbi:MAG: ACT domain-containing protein [Lachnospiraceae bacterium]|nr:ACT domain-containing protein [Lachnospiraceae bacterium]
MKKAIITVVGKDKVGIIAGICTFLAKEHVNILDITQTIVDGYFNMMMVVDLAGMVGNFNELQSELGKLGEGLGVMASVQLEEIFERMHRL